MSNTCSEKASQLLLHPEKYPGLEPRDLADRLVLLWRNDSFGDYCSWSIFDYPHRSYERRITWNQRFLYWSKEPVTYASEAILSKNLSIKIINDLNSIDFDRSKPRENEFCIDGVRYGIIMKDCVVEWLHGSRQKDEEIEALDRWCINTISILESFLPKSISEYVINSNFV